MIRLQRLQFLFFIVLHLIISGCRTSQGYVSPINPYQNLLHKFADGLSLPQPSFTLQDPGLSAALDYSHYGEFQNIGTAQYRYVIKDAAQLKKDIGEGIYPNEEGVYNDPAFREMKKAGLLKGSHWDYTNAKNKQQAFYIWTQAPEDKGVRTFFIAKTLEASGNIFPALKAYYAVLVHFPRSAAWAADQSFVWYLAPSAIGDIQRLCRDYAALNCELQGAEFSILNGDDTDLRNDIIQFNPGRIVHKTEKAKSRLVDLSQEKIVHRRGNGQVQLVQYANGHWQMLVDHEPFMIRGISYNPTEIGLGPNTDSNFHDQWMWTDKNQNGLIDAPYDVWVDKNRNERQDADEPSIGDFQLLKEMGVNAIRWFAPNRPLVSYNPSLVNKPLLRDLFSRYGIRVIVGDFLGAYTLGSGASWERGTDYTDPQQRHKMKEAVKAKVLDLKDEPFVLMWLLGNENNLPGDYLGVNASRTNAASEPEAFAKFLNEVAEMIHELDPNHPVAVGNVELGLFEYYRQYAPALDVLGINAYRGEKGFGGLFGDVRKVFDRPVLITEYGSDAYHEGEGINEEEQWVYHEGNVRDIVLNQAGGPMTGNAIGGVIFEYLDEWWKAPGDPENKQINSPQGYHPFLDGRNHEEWFGIAGQGTGQNSPFQRQLRKTYYFYKDIWGER
jgi:beta-glucuronidase